MIVRLIELFPADFKLHQPQNLIMLEIENLNVEEFYAYSAIFLIGKEGLGRRRLAHKLGLTESKTRTMLKHLKQAGYIQTTEKTDLTTEGEEVFSYLEGKILETEKIDLDYLGIGEFAFGALVNVEKDFRVISLRDEAVRAGAKGLTVLNYQNGFTFPEDEDPQREEFENDITLLEKAFSPENGQKLLISSGSEEEARRGLWRALYHLHED